MTKHKEQYYMKVRTNIALGTGITSSGKKLLDNDTQ